MGCSSSSPVPADGTQPVPANGTQASPAPAKTPSSGAQEPWMQSVHIVFVLGGPGSGKGTQCTLIKEKFGFTHLSVGDLLRKEVASGSDRGKECEQIMKDGKLVPVDVTLDLLKDAMKEAVEGKSNSDPARTFLIDGFPRELSQAKAFKAKFHRDCDYVLYFECSEKAMIERIMKRAETSGRADDNEATIVKRLKTFTDQTVPVVKHYKKLNRLRRVNAEFAVDQIFGATDRIIREELVSQAQIVFVLGGPGCGKGTQCARIAQKCSYAHLSTGDLLRAEVAAGSELGKRCSAIMADGKLVSVEDTLTLLQNAMLREVTHVNGFLIDGFPRELSQVQAFQATLHRQCNFALYFECTEQVMETRILQRGLSSGRADDNAEAAKKRLETFRLQSLPVVNFFEKKHMLKKINAERPVETVFDEAAKLFPTASA